MSALELNQDALRRQLVSPQVVDVLIDKINQQQCEIQKISDKYQSTNQLLHRVEI